MRTLRAEVVGDFRESLQGWPDPIGYGVGHDGALYAASRRDTAEPLREEGFPKSRLSAATDYLIVRTLDGETRSMVVKGEQIVVSFVQTHPRGLLLVGSRCHWRPEGPERNAVVVDWDGQAQERLTLGDGVEDVRVHPDGSIHAGYFDEGVFGNFGWNSPGPTPIGASGLVGFDADGTVRFEYDPRAARTDAICDAYAMCVGADGAIWVCFYSEFPLVRIHEGRYRAWKLGVRGARALAVGDGRALLFGDYDRRNLGRVVEMSAKGVARVVEEALVVDESSDSMGDAVACGHGASLYLFRDGQARVLRGW